MPISGRVAPSRRGEIMRLAPYALPVGAIARTFYQRRLLVGARAASLWSGDVIRENRTARPSPKFITEITPPLYMGKTDGSPLSVARPRPIYIAIPLFQYVGPGVRCARSVCREEYVAISAYFRHPVNNEMRQISAIRRREMSRPMSISGARRPGYIWRNNAPDAL